MLERFVRHRRRHIHDRCGFDVGWVGSLGSTGRSCLIDGALVRVRSDFGV